MRVLYLPSPLDYISTHVDDFLRERFEGSRHELAFFDHEGDITEQFADADIVIDRGGSVGTREMLHAAKAARLWQVLGMGLDHFDLDYWAERGMPVSHCPGPMSAVALGESSMMFILMLGHRYREASRNLEHGVWFSPVGLEVAGARLCIIGFGASGRELAIRARAHGMDISAIDIQPISDEEADSYELVASGPPESIDGELSLADYVSLHLPLNAETRAILSRKRLALLRRTACVVNVARGGLIDQQALVEALEAGLIAGAGLDVLIEEPAPQDLVDRLLALPNVVMTPHVAGMTDGTARRRAEAALENCDRIERGLEPLYRVV